MIYLDNAATSFPKPRSVVREVNKCIRHYCGNPSRSSHYLALKASEEIYLTREKVCEFFGSNAPERVVFTQNTTYALNIAIKCLVQKGSHVITSDVEHNSVLRPLTKLRDEGALSFSVYSTDGDIYKNIEEKITPDTRAIITTLASNVTGRAISPAVIYEISKKHKLITIIDAAQAAGHLKIDESLTPFTAICAPAHKGLLGIQGCGFVLFGDKVPINTLIEGGSGSYSASERMPSVLPDMLEAGTLPTPSVVSLRRGIEYIEKIGFAEITKKLNALTDRYRERLETIPGCDIYGGECGIISFRIAEIPSYVIAEKLSKKGICVRSGLHCAPAAHKKLGTLESGLVRISLSTFSNQCDADKFYKALRCFLK